MLHRCSIGGPSPLEGGAARHSTDVSTCIHLSAAASRGHLWLPMATYGYLWLRPDYLWLQDSPGR